MIELKKLAQAGVQFGHLTSRWCPKMKPVIWGSKNGIHLIDLSKTAYELEKAAQFLESVAETGRPILWVGTKRAARAAVESIAQSVQSPHVTHRWIGGILTNYSQVKKSITKLLHYEDIVDRAEESHYTKKEISSYGKLRDRLSKNVGGIRHITWPIGAIVIVDVKKEHVAIKEAIASGVPVVALVDTNSDPSNIKHAIPANDDAPSSVQLLLSVLGEAVARGRERAQVTRQQVEEASAGELTVEQLLQQAFGSEDGEKSSASGRRSNNSGRSHGAGNGSRGNYRRPQNSARTQTASEPAKDQKDQSE